MVFSGWNIDLKKQSDSLIDHKICLRCSSQKTLLQLLFAENDEKLLEYVSFMKTNSLLKENELNRIRDFFTRNQNLKMRKFAYKVILEKKNILDITKCTKLFYSWADPKIPRDVTRANQPYHNFNKDYFIEQTKMIQEMKYVKRSKYFRELSLQTLEMIRNKYLYKGKLMPRICDKYIMLEALSIDILTNETDNIKLSDRLLNIRDKEYILKMSSYPDLLRCMLLVRRAVIGSFNQQQKTTKGEAIISDIFQMMDSLQPCVEHVDILYRIVIFQRALFKSSPDRVTTRIEQLLDRAKCLLQMESNEVKLFWETRFSIRLLFCYLGMGMRGVFIANYVITDDIKEKANKLIDFSDSKHSPLRIKMIFYMAKARYFDLTCETEKAIKCNENAKDIAERGNYNEKTTIIENDKRIRNRWRLN